MKSFYKFYEYYINIQRSQRQFVYVMFCTFVFFVKVTGAYKEC